LKIGFSSSLLCILFFGEGLVSGKYYPYLDLSAKAAIEREGQVKGLQKTKANDEVS
jgi:hypothetical protein